MRQLIAGNWKMNGLLGDVPAYAEAISTQAGHADLLVCPPFLLLAAFAKVLAGSGIGVGAQDCHVAASGAHTGDISAAMIKDAGAAYVILGHSERRADHGETSSMVAAKEAAARAAGLTPIICVGETEAERNGGHAQATVRAQLQASLTEGFAGVVAYEPIWAIGTGRIPTEADITAMHATIRGVLAARFGAAGAALRILYGGSVKPGNAARLLALPEVGGALVGGASLAAADFLAIAAGAARD